jgi:hypothetical protein
VHGPNQLPVKEGKKKVSASFFLIFSNVVNKAVYNLLR